MYLHLHTSNLLVVYHYEDLTKYLPLHKQLIIVLVFWNKINSYPLYLKGKGGEVRREISITYMFGSKEQGGERGNFDYMYVGFVSRADKWAAYSAHVGQHI